eukprot:gene15569-21666_t
MALSAINRLHARSIGVLQFPKLSIPVGIPARCKASTRDIIDEMPQQTEQIGEYASRQIAGNVIDMGVGHPSPKSLPLATIQRASQHRLSSSEDSALLLQYGPRGGYPSFRRALAGFLSTRYGTAV